MKSTEGKFSLVHFWYTDWWVQGSHPPQHPFQGHGCSHVLFLVILSVVF